MVRHKRYVSIMLALLLIVCLVTPTGAEQATGIKPARTEHVAGTAQAFHALSPSVLPARLNTGEQIGWQVISAGGGSAGSANFALSGTVGQTAAGWASSPSYGVNQGFWQAFAGGNCCTAAATGDIDGSGGVDISDLSIVVDYLFFGGSLGGCDLENDVDKSGSVDISDLSLVVDFLFFGGLLPSCP